MRGPSLNAIHFQGVLEDSLPLGPRQVRHQRQRLERPAAQLVLAEGGRTRLADAELLELLGRNSE
jgi:hypothetical protein